MNLGGKLPRLAAIAAVTLALAGCSASDVSESPEATPSPSENPNIAACEDFAAVTVELAEAMVEGSTDMRVTTEGMLERIDESYLAAEGEVATRINTLMSELPDQGLYMLYVDSEAYAANVQAVHRACTAEGSTVDMATWG